MKPDFSIQNTVPKAFWFHVKQKPESVANWQKLNGVWEPQTWQEYGALAKQIGLALKSSGMEKADDSISNNINKLSQLFDSIKTDDNKEEIENSILNELNILKENLKLRASILKR